MHGQPWIKEHSSILRGRGAVAMVSSLPIEVTKVNRRIHFADLDQTGENFLSYDPRISCPTRPNHEILL